MNDFFGVFNPRNNLNKTIEELFEPLLYTLDNDNLYYPFNANDSRLLSNIQQAISALETITNDAGKIANSAKSYYNFLENQAFGGENYASRDLIFGLWKKALMNVVDFDNLEDSSSQEPAMQIIDCLRPHMNNFLIPPPKEKFKKQDLLSIFFAQRTENSPEELPQSRGLDFLIQGEECVTPLGRFILEFYRRYNGNPGNSWCLKQHCDEALKYRRLFYNPDTRTEIGKIDFMWPGIARTIVSEIESSDVSKELKSLFEKIATRQVAEDFQKIWKTTLESLTAVGELLDSGLKRVDAEKLPAEAIHNQQHE